MPDTASMIAARPVACTHCGKAVRPGSPDARVELWADGDRSGRDYYHAPCWQEARYTYRGSPRARPAE